MLTKDDEKKIKKVIDEAVDGVINGPVYEKKISVIVKKELQPIQEQIEDVRGTVIKIERDRKILKDIWEFIKDHTRQLDNHEERISSLESSPKVS